MKSIRLILVLAIAFLAMAAAGCGKAYVYDFANEGSFIRGDEEWFSYVFPSGTAEFTSDGVYLDGSCVSSPLEFSGDMTYTAEFLLNVDAGHTCDILICMTDAIGIAHDSGLHFSFKSVGNPSAESCTISDLNMTMAQMEIHMDTPGQIPGLQRGGANVFRMVKRGNNVRATINGVFLAEFELRWYSSPWFNPAIMGDLAGEAASEYGFTLKSVSVKYSGDVKPMDL